MSLYKLKKITAEEYLKDYLEVEFCEDDLVFGLEHYMNNFDFNGNLLTGEQISEYNMNMSASFSYYPLNEIDYLSEEWDENALSYVVVDDLIWEIPTEFAYAALKLMPSTMSLPELRKTRGLTLNVVSKATGLAISTISKAENFLISITPKIAKKLSEFYGVEIKPRKLVPNYEDYKPVAGEREKVLMAVRKENEILKDRVKTLEDKLEKIKTVLAV
jgi:transcriptional regulator with XRE-family HTH domain